jgi:hypothetical protein
VLLFYPLLQRAQKRCDHVEAVFFDQVLSIALLLLLYLILPPQCRQIRELVPIDLGNFLPRPRLKVCVHGYSAEDVQHHTLFAHRDGNLLHVFFGLDQVSLPQVVACLLPDLSYSAIEIRLFLVDLSAGKTPFCALLPALDQDSVCHVLVEHDGAAHRDPGLVGEELFVGLLVQLFRVGGEERAVLEHELGESAQVHRGQVVGVERTDEVFVEPLGFLDLEAYSLDRLQLFIGQVDDEAHAEVVEPVN